jgi:hypothetical protein
MNACFASAAGACVPGNAGVEEIGILWKNYKDSSAIHELERRL